VQAAVIGKEGIRVCQKTGRRRRGTIEDAGMSREGGERVNYPRLFFDRNQDLNFVACN